MTSLIGKLANRVPVPLAPRASVLAIPFAGRSDAKGQMEAMGQVSTLFSIVDRTATATGQVEWRLYRKQIDGRRTTATEDEAPRREVTRHPALNLWNKPNPFMTGGELREIIQQHQDLTGEWWLVIGRDPRARLPMELWPVRPDRIQPVPHPTQFIAGYIYNGPNGEQIPLGIDDVIGSKLPNPLDPYRGLGPVQAAMVDLHSARFSAEWNRNFFLNSAEPGGHLETERNLDDDEFEQLTKRWREQHQGINNAHRVAILEGGVKWTERKFTMRDMQFAELRGVSREIIREAFGIHPHMLGLTEDVNKANAQEAERHFARWLIRPRAERMKRVLNDKLLPLFGADNVEFDHDRVVPEDREADDRERTSKAQAAKFLIEAHYDPADVADAVGLPQMGVVEPPQPEPAAPAVPPA